jgi:tetratricopeptide (TPR) repeat protein
VSLQLRNIKKAFQIFGGLFLFLSPVYAQSVVDYVQIGNSSYAKGKYDQAIEAYTKAIDIDPDFAKAYDNRGAAYAQEGNLSSAISDFTMAIANNPNDAEAYNNRGRAYAKLGDYVPAVSDFTKAIKIEPDYTKAYNNRAHVFYDIKKYDRALADVQKVQALGGTVDPDFLEELKQHPFLSIHS